MTPRQRLLAAIKHDPALVDRLLVVAEPNHDDAVATPDAAYRMVAPLIQGEPVECFAVVALNRRRIPIASAILTRGNDAYCVVCPRQVLRWALLQGRSGASAIIIAHNHPSGDSTPSEQDREVTRKIAAAARVLGIPLLDHIVVGDDNFTSFANEGML